MSPARAAFAFCVALGLASRASPAAAWTDTRVTGAGAFIDLTARDSARVRLTVQLRVLGGYLSSLDLVGLDPDLELDATAPATLTSATGAIYAPAVASPEPGSLVLGFPDRRAAPWRGDYTLSVSYRSAKLRSGLPASGDDHTRIEWSMPSWEVGLQNVRVDVLAPPGAVLPASVGGYGDSVEVERADGLTRLRFVRAELPRTERLSLAIVVPNAHGAGAVPVRAPRAPTLPWPWPSPAPLAALLALAWLVVAKRRCHALPKRADALSLLACLLAGATFDTLPALSMACAVTGVASGLARGSIAPARSFDVRTWRGRALLALLHAVWLGGLAGEAHRDLACVVALLATPLFFDQLAFLRMSSTSGSRSLSSRATASLSMSKSISAELTSS